ncbi:hypothetical protein [Verrucosispora sp. TAA-831]|uniref:hypothetical protein n=1 Tax=Verrucosispora sp. TAA-831 TaxID=3422227 RepID=UPI003D6E8F5D
MTDRVVTVPNVSAIGGVEHPRASARARVNQSVTHRDQKSVRRNARQVDAARRLGVRAAGWARATGRVMYLDAADSWIVRERSQTIRQVWSTDYAAAAPGDFAPFRRWCRAYRYPAVAATVVLDSVKWLLVHPVRGPLSIATCVGIAAVIH